MKIFFTKGKRDKWVRKRLNENPQSIVVSGNFLPLPIFTALIIK